MQRLTYWVQTHKLMSFAIAFGVGAVIILYLRSRTGGAGDAASTGNGGTVGSTGDSDPYGQGGNTYYFQFLPPNNGGGGVTGGQTPPANVGSTGGTPGPTAQPPNPTAPAPVTPATAVPAGQAIAGAINIARADQQIAHNDAVKMFSYQKPPVGSTLGAAIAKAISSAKPTAASVPAGDTRQAVPQIPVFHFSILPPRPAPAPTVGRSVPVYTTRGSRQ